MIVANIHASPYNSPPHPVWKTLPLAIPKQKTRSFTRSEVASARVLLRGIMLKRY